MLAAGDDELQLRLLGLVTEGMPSAMHLVMALQATRRNIRKLFLFFFPLLPGFYFVRGGGQQEEFFGRVGGVKIRDGKVIKRFSVKPAFTKCTVVAVYFSVSERKYASRCLQTKKKMCYEYVLSEWETVRTGNVFFFLRERKKQKWR